MSRYFDARSSSKAISGSITLDSILIKRRNSRNVRTRRIIHKKFPSSSFGQRYLWMLECKSSIPPIPISTYKLWNSTGRIAILCFVVHVPNNSFQNVAGHVWKVDDIVLRLPERSFQHGADGLAVGDGYGAIQEKLMALRRDQFNVLDAVLFSTHGTPPPNLRDALVTCPWIVTSSCIVEFYHQEQELCVFGWSFLDTVTVGTTYWRTLH